ncbi:MAG: ankyrin repeat domain-containing protein [Devosia sp.]
MSDPFELVAGGDIETLRQALAHDPALASSRHSGGASLRAWAADMGKPDAVAAIRALLSELDAYEAIIVGDDPALEAAFRRGWDGNALSRDGFSPLALAAFFDNAAAFDRLLPLTADVSRQAENPQRVAALHAATARRNAGLVEKLLRAGAEPDQAQADGFTPLHVAAQHGDAAIAAMLVLFGADPKRKDARGMDAAAHARAGGHEWLAVRLEG